jgi:leucyl-tRNA synthetase
VDPAAEAYWGTPDFYIGGAEHAVLHLLYARFWHLFLHDRGLVRRAEPYPRLFHQGIILGEDGSKMSKSRGNVVNPDRVIESHGADALRLFEMFLGPLEAVKPWDMRGMEGMARFLKRLWHCFLGPDGKISEKFGEEHSDDAHTQRLFHETIRKVGESIESIRFNVAISQLMIFLNHLLKLERIALSTGKIFLQLLAPFAPHIAEELWHRSGEGGAIVQKPFPIHDPEKLRYETVTLIVQVNGKLRSEIQVPADLPSDEVIKTAKFDGKIEPYLINGEVIKEIYVPHRVVNFVVR